MSVDSRPSRSALFKRAEQLKRWEQSDTNREPGVINGNSRKIKFSAGCVFLAACAAGDKEEVLSLLKKGADIDTTNVDGLSALHQACIDDNLDMVEFLVEHGADVNKGDNEGWTPLHATASCGFISIAKYLIEKGANVAAVNHDGELPLDIAEYDPMEDLLQQHIEQRGINAEDARTEEQRVMLEDAKNWLSIGCIEDTLHPKTGATALHVAAAKGYVKVMDILLQAGFNVDVQDLDGWTPLHAAAHWGQRETCKLLVHHFCDMDTKNCVGQTVFDVADSQMVPYLEELRKEQCSLTQDNLISKKKNNNTIQIEPIGARRGRNVTNLEIELGNDTLMDKNKVPQVPQIEVQIQPIPNDQSKIEKKNVTNRDEPVKKSDQSSPLTDVSKPVPNSPAPSSPKQSPNDEDENGIASWRRPGSFRNKEDSPRLNLPLKINERDSSRTSSIGNTSKVETPQEVVLRRTQSFEADEKFYRRYLELRAKINAGNTCSVINSPTRSASLKEKHFSRWGESKESGGETASGAGWAGSVSGGSVSGGSVSGGSPSATTGPSPASPSSPGTSPQHTNQVRRSFVPPVRDEESETQRKAHAKRVRETRRSTQGVTLEEIKSAEQLVKKKQNQAATAPSPNPVNSSLTQEGWSGEGELSVPSSLMSVSKEKESEDEEVRGATETVSATIVTQGKPGQVVGDRRPSWRLKVNNGSKFMLEDARTSNDEDKLPAKGPPEAGETTVTLPLRRREDREQDKENDIRCAQATQGVIQRRRRPKRRSTGVVQVDMDDIDPERNVEVGEAASNNEEMEARVNRVESEGEKDKTEVQSRVGPAVSSEQDESESASENGEIDYKKLYEESQLENKRLREKLKKTEDDLQRAKLMSDKVPYVPMRNSLSEAEKREKRAMERKLSEMEEELKQLEQLKCENQKLKDENGALIRVISKLSK